MLVESLRRVLMGQSWDPKSAGDVGLKESAMQRPEILCETFTDLKAKGPSCARGIRRVALGNYFTVVELDDCSIGAALSYYQGSSEALQTASARITDLAGSDRWLDGLLFGDSTSSLLQGITSVPENLVLMSLLAAVVSALSASLIMEGGDETFFAAPSIPFDPFDGVNSAVILGLGGYLETLMMKEEIKHVHVADLKHSVQDMKRSISRFGKCASNKFVTFSDGSDTVGRLQTAELVCITGSALCNGTMEAVLDAAQHCRRVIVQGQSASIHPRAFFRRGVDLIATTVKPIELIKCAESDPSGRQLKQFLEGGLPWIYLLPR